MYHIIPISQLRDRLGHYVTQAEREGVPTLIRRGRREAGALVSVRELDLLRNAREGRLEFKAHSVAEEMLRWRIIREGMAELAHEQRLKERRSDPERFQQQYELYEALKRIVEVE